MRAGFLGLSEAQVGAVVALEFDAGDGARDLCSGAMLNAESLVTAAHCFVTQASGLRIVGANWERSISIADTIVDLHPLLDVAVVEIGGLDAPFALPTASGAEVSHVGEFVEIAGAGLRENGAAGLVQFAVAEIKSVSATSLQVELPGGGGPCGGDSGGPLLRRGPSGAIEIAGILSQGSPICQGPDSYERLDTLSDWLEQRVGPPASTESACSGLGTTGRCFGNRAVWCDAGVELAADCGSGSVCGWDLSSHGFRCVDQDGGDACGGVPELGRCDSENVQRCVNGTVEQLSCAVCGGTCAISSRTGKAVCSEAASP